MYVFIYLKKHTIFNVKLKLTALHDYDNTKILVLNLNYSVEK